MKALTICQPYATLIARGEKRVENRSWPTSYRGPLAIHAGKSREWLVLSDDGVYDEDYDIPLAAMPFGAIVALSRLVAVVPIAAVRARTLPADLAWVADHPHATGPYCWMLADITPLSVPFPVSGRQGLWEWTPPATFTLPSGWQPPPLDQSAI